MWRICSKFHENKQSFTQNSSPYLPWVPKSSLRIPHIKLYSAFSRHLNLTHSQSKASTHINSRKKKKVDIATPCYEQFLPHGTSIGDELLSSYWPWCPMRSDIFFTEFCGHLQTYGLVKEKKKKRVVALSPPLVPCIKLSTWENIYVLPRPTLFILYLASYLQYLNEQMPKTTLLQANTFS